VPLITSLACCRGDPAGARSSSPSVGDLSDPRPAAPADGAADAAPPCPGPAVPRLESYLDVRIPDVYWLEMNHGSGGWEPAQHLRMPLHHATRLDLTNLADFPHLAAGVTGPVRLVIEITARDIEHDPARATWFATYHARIVEVCPAGA